MLERPPHPGPLPQNDRGETDWRGENCSRDHFGGEGAAYAALGGTFSAGAEAGFTLIELLIVIAIIGLIASVAVVRLGDTSRRARIEQAVGRLAGADAQMRRHSARHARAGTIAFDLGAGRLRRLHGNGERPAITDLGRIEIARFISRTRATSSGTASVDFTPEGTSESYAVELMSAAGEPVWLLFAGTTGQMTRLENESDVEAVFQIIDEARADAR